MIALIIALIALILAIWAIGAAQASYRLTRRNQDRINKIEEEYIEEEVITYICSACTRRIDKDEVVNVQVDLPMNSESTILLPVTIELCKDCSEIGTQA
jgi:flagellar basal body-associated protein FliL